MLTAPTRPLKQFRPESPTMKIGTLERKTADLSVGSVSYLRHGKGEPLLLVHGIPTSCRLWEPLLGLLGESYDCIVPDLLGLGRTTPAPAADLSSPGQAAMLVELLDALGIGETLAVFHDQGGAHGMRLLERAGERIRAVVLTNVVCYDNWPVPAVDVLMWLARPRWPVRALANTGLVQGALSFFPLRQTVARGPLPKELVDDWDYPLDAGGPALEEWMRYVVSQSNRHTMETVPTLRAWTKPTMVLWGAHDRFLPVSWGVRLARDVPGAADDPKLLPFAGHFWQADVPESGARAIRDFFDGVG